LTIRNIPYPNVQVTDVANCKISYQLRGSGFERMLRDVNLIHLDGRNDFNEAEKSMKAGQAVEAALLYDKAAQAETAKSWRMWLIRHRRLRALDAAKTIDRAVEDWLAIAERNAGSRASLALCPTGIDTDDTEAIATAARLLKARLPGAKDKAYQASIRALLKRLGDKPATGTGATATPTGAAPGPDVGMRTDVSVGAGSLRGTLKEAADQIAGGQYAAAATKIRSGLSGFSSRELPVALLLQGKALLLSYEKGPAKSQATLLEAGLSFMRVAACMDPSTPEVPESMFLAARVCAHLGNKVAAANAYRRIRQRQADTEWAKKAEEAERALAGN
jgi:TolA-binding protein